MHRQATCIFDLGLILTISKRISQQYVALRTPGDGFYLVPLLSDADWCLRSDVNLWLQVQDVHNATLSGTIAVTTLTRTYDFDDVLGFVERREFAAMGFDDDDQTTSADAFKALIAALGAIEDTGVVGFHPTQVIMQNGQRTRLMAYPSINF